MPRLSRERLDDRRQHILRAATVCFARDGFHRTTIADVRREADVSTGAIYTYFANKEAIIRAILEQARHERRAQLGDPKQSAPKNALPQALVLLDWVRAIFSAHGQHVARVDVNLWAEAVRSRRVAKIAHAALSEATQAVSAVVEQRMRASGGSAPALRGGASGGSAPALRGGASGGTAPALDTGTVASVLVSIFLGLEVQTAVGIAIDPDAVVRVLAALFGTQLEPPAKPRRRRKKA